MTFSGFPGAPRPSAGKPGNGSQAPVTDQPDTGKPTTEPGGGGIEGVKSGSFDPAGVRFPPR